MKEKAKKEEKKKKDLGFVVQERKRRERSTKVIKCMRVGMMVCLCRITCASRAQRFSTWDETDRTLSNTHSIVKIEFIHAQGAVRGLGSKHVA
jgi:hypothetical protein